MDHVTRFAIHKEANIAAPAGDFASDASGSIVVFTFPSSLSFFSGRTEY